MRQRGFGVRAPVVISSTISNNDVMSYDGMYQLATLQRGELNANKNGLVAETKTFAEQWTLDPTGNWTNFKQDPDGDGDWDLDQNRTHNKANEIATVAAASTHVAHDRSGNMTRAPKPSDWADHYHLEYDAWNRLVTVYDADETTLVAGYDYDGLGRRVIKETYTAGSLSEMRHHYYSRNWQVLEERVQQCYGSSGSASAPESLYPERQFVWGLRYVNDLVLRDRDTDTNGSLDERLYALQDPNWNVVAIANTSGTILKRFCYSAYGAPEYFTSDFSDSTAGYDWETLYCGYRYDYHTDSDVKWHIAGHRILLSHLGRWNRKDPIGYDAEDMDLYLYVGNGPVTHTDPFGLKKGDPGDKESIECYPNKDQKKAGTAVLTTPPDLDGDGKADYYYPGELKNSGYRLYCLSGTMGFYVRKEPNGPYVHRCPWDDGINNFKPGNGFWGSSEDPKTGNTIIYYYDPAKGTLVIEVWDKHPLDHKDAKIIRSETIIAPTKPTDIPRPEHVPPVKKTSQCPDAEVLG